MLTDELVDDIGPSIEHGHRSVGGSTTDSASAAGLYPSLPEDDDALSTLMNLVENAKDGKVLGFTV